MYINAERGIIMKKTDRQKYEEVQDRLRKKLKKWPSRKESAYNDGILCAMSIIKDVYGLPERRDHEY